MKGFWTVLASHTCIYCAEKFVQSWKAPDGVCMACAYPHKGVEPRTIAVAVGQVGAWYPAPDWKA